MPTKDKKLHQLLAKLERQKNSLHTTMYEMEAYLSPKLDFTGYRVHYWPVQREFIVEYGGYTCLLTDVIDYNSKMSLDYFIYLST